MYLYFNQTSKNMTQFSLEDRINYNLNKEKTDLCKVKNFLVTDT